jgi:glutamine amidotransferase
VCELFALSSRYPTTVRFSLERFARHGRLVGAHKDGWGIDYCVDEDVRLVKEPAAAADSACMRFIHENPFASTIVVSHIRRATRGAVAMKNCQPFARELGGRMHVFAHNGDLDPDGLRSRLAAGSCRPIGDTDSQRAFCALLETLRDMWLRGGVPALEERLAIVARFAVALRPLGPANFVYSDGDALFVHGHRRFHGDDREPHPPGPHVLCRRCAVGADVVAIEGLKRAADSEQEVANAASVPLTSEPGRRPLAEGETVAVRGGKIVAVHVPRQRR